MKKLDLFKSVVVGGLLAATFAMTACGSMGSGTGSASGSTTVTPSRATTSGSVSGTASGAVTP